MMRETGSGNTKETKEWKIGEGREMEAEKCIRRQGNVGKTNEPASKNPTKYGRRSFSLFALFESLVAAMSVTFWQHNGQYTKL
ncbi:MAG: hypothetical protein ABSE16_09260 [Verrucomicrobiota bacterium]